MKPFEPFEPLECFIVLNVHRESCIVYYDFLAAETQRRGGVQ